ncbi:MAG TPA: thiamine phosphate synthase [Polyangiales bacterium]
MFDLYLITDPDTHGGVVQAVREALRELPQGRVAVQLRAKTASNATLLGLARELRAVTRDAQVPLLINSSLEVADAVAADGVHLPEQGPSVASARALLGPRVLVGVSCHDVDGLLRASREAASFVTLGPVLEVPGKGTPLGWARFAQLAASARLPAFALGGLGPAHAQAACAAGAYGLAVIRSVFAAPDRSRAVHDCLRALDQARRLAVDTGDPVPEP